MNVGVLPAGRTVVSFVRQSFAQCRSVVVKASTVIVRAVSVFTKYLVPGVSRGRGRCVAPFALLQREHAELGSAAGREGGGLLLPL